MATSLAFPFTQATSAQRRTLVAAALGWMLDAFDAMLYALVLAHVMRDLGMTKGTAGLLNSLTLLASGIGGVAFGFIADRLGRKRALMLSILTYSVCSFASGLATSVLMLAVFRFILGLGMGGEWNTGATLVAETWPTELRAKSHLHCPEFVGHRLRSGRAGGGNRAALRRLAHGVLRRNSARAGGLVDSPRRARVGNVAATRARAELTHSSGERTQMGFAGLFKPPYGKHTLALLFMNFFGMFAWWGLFTWIPPYLSLPVEQGGRGFGIMGTTTLLVVLNLVGMFPGYASFGWVADYIGRRKSFILYTFMAAVIVPIYAMARAPWALMVLGTVLAFFGTGFFSGSGIIGSEIFPTSVRARALGFTYNGARTMSSIAPFVIGRVGQAKGLSWAFYLVRCLVSAVVPGGDAVAGDERETIGVTDPYRKPLVILSEEFASRSEANPQSKDPCLTNQPRPAWETSHTRQ